MITLDWTLMVAAAVFLLTLWALNQLLFRPLFEVLEKREALTTQTRAEAARKTEYREALYREYSDKIKEEKQKGYQLAESRRREALESRQQTVSNARREAEALLVKARAELEEEFSRVKVRLKGDAEEIANTIASRVLERT
jgi:F-type H+-transporting ATPase subunit b